MMSENGTHEGHRHRPVLGHHLALADDVTALGDLFDYRLGAFETGFGEMPSLPLNLPGFLAGKATTFEVFDPLTKRARCGCAGMVERYRSCSTRMACKAIFPAISAGAGSLQPACGPAELFEQRRFRG